MFEVEVVQLASHGVGSVGVEGGRLGAIFLVRRHERRLLDGVNQQRVAADDTDVALLADDARNSRRIVVVFLVIEREQRLDEGVAGRIAEVELFGYRVDLRAVSDDGVFAVRRDAESVVRDVRVVRLRGIGRRADRERLLTLGDLSIRKRP